MSGKLQDFVQRVQRRRLEQAMQAVEVGSTTSQLPAEEMLTRLDATRAQQELFMEAMQAATHATVDAKISAIGVALASGALAKEPMVVDHERLFVQAMAEFELPHVWLRSHREGAGDQSDGDLHA